jgi:hypothetical protein
MAVVVCVSAAAIRVGVVAPSAGLVGVLVVDEAGEVLRARAVDPVLLDGRAAAVLR